MKDGIGRTIEYLRISLTDKCNLRCKYCMPECGVKHLAHDEILTLEEISRLTNLLAKLGIKRVRITGGEPLVKKNVCKLISDINQIDEIERISLTTNGILLKDMSADLLSAGIDDVNISLDTLNREKYKELTGEDNLSKVLDSIDCAIEMNLKPKINCVPMKEWNEDEIAEIANLAHDKNIDVRFIELMPTKYGKQFTKIDNKDVLEKLEECFGKAGLIENSEGVNGPAKYYQFDGFNGRVGFISPISNNFCSSCNRIRLTPTGYLKLCLHQNDGADLKSLLRDGKSDEKIINVIKDAINKKPEAHNMMQNADDTNMYRIGG